MKTKQALIFVALALLASSIFISCSRSSGDAASATDEPANSISLWIWDPNIGVYVARRSAEIYAETHPGFNVEIIEVSGSDDLETRLTVIASSGDLSSLPDIFFMQDNSFIKYVSYYPELFTDLTDSGIDFSQYPQVKIAYSTINGRNYGVPFDNAAVMHAVRTDYLEQAGFTSEDFDNLTWEEYIEKARVVRQATGQPMLTVVSGEPDIIIMMLYSAGAALFHDDGSVYIEDNELLRQCMEYYVTMAREGILVEVIDWDQYIASVNNGTVAGIIQGSYLIGSMTAQPNQSGKWRVIKMPRLSGVPGATHYSVNGGSSFAISSNCSNLELAVDFINSTFAGSTALYDDMISKGTIASWMPAADSAVYNQPVEFFGGQEVYSTIVEFSKHIPTFATSPFHYDARAAIGVALSNIIQRGADMDAELRSAQSIVEFNMEE